MPRIRFNITDFVNDTTNDPANAANHLIAALQNIAQPQQPVVINNYYVQNVAATAPGAVNPTNTTTLATYNNRNDTRNTNRFAPQIETPISDYNGVRMTTKSLSYVNQTGVLKRFLSTIVLPTNLQRLSELIEHCNGAFPTATRNRILTAILDAWENLPPLYKVHLEGAALTKPNVDATTPTAMFITCFMTDSALLASALAPPTDRRAASAARKPFITLCPICHSQYAPLRDTLDPTAILIPAPSTQRDRGRFPANHSYLDYDKLLDHFATVSQNDSPTFVAMHRYLSEIFTELDSPDEASPLWQVVEDEYNLTFPVIPATPPPMIPHLLLLLHLLLLHLLHFLLLLLLQ